MRRRILETAGAAAILVAALATGDAGAGAPAGNAEAPFVDRFDLASCHWSSRGRNDFFILEPGYQLVLEGGEGKKLSHVEITVLDQTRTLGGIETRVIEERESLGGQLVEVSRNFYAVCGPSGDVYYFGEDVDTYKDGKISDHDGAWAAFSGGARAALFMPAKPAKGARYYQELAPGIAMDRVEIVGVAESLKTPAGSFEGCVMTEETTPLEPEVRDHKIYARGVGVAKEDDLLLVRYGFVGPKSP